jgi:hypothetical protein
MRTKTMFLMAAAMAAGVVTTMAQGTVYSLNIVGYVNRVCQGTNRYSLVSNPLNRTDAGGNNYSNLFQTLPVSSKILRWTGSGYSTATRSTSATGWSPNPSWNTLCPPGSAVFIQAPLDPTGSIGWITNTFTGDVPTGMLTNAIPLGYSMIGNMTADAGDVTTNLSLTAAIIYATPSPQSTIQVWNETSQGYSTYTRNNTVAGYAGGAPIMSVAQGFFVNNLKLATNWIRSFNP